MSEYAPVFGAKYNLLAVIVGPGYTPLNSWHGFAPLPSGLQVPLVISRLNGTVFPVVGNLASKSVAALKPSDQHDRVKGPLVQAASGTFVEVAVGVAEVACRFSIVVGGPFGPQR
jgi:hypothetical protein